MNQIQLAVTDPEDVKALFELAESSDDIDIIQEKNFSGDITTIELYISMAINVMVVVVPLIKTLIKQRKISSLVVNGNKIELKNVSEELIVKVLEQKINVPDETVPVTQTEENVC